jgi:UDP-N-acetylmuramyl pentapeptide synthase
MKNRFRDIPSLMLNPLGRLTLARSVFQFFWPVFFRGAYLYRRTFVRKTRIVAVVGSLGKSTTARTVTAALGGRVDRLSERNSYSFLSRAIFRVRPRDRHAVIEVGVGAVGEMAVYARMIRPDITVVTTIASEHQRSFGTLEVTRAEKSEMVSPMTEEGIAVLNGDDPNVMWMAEKTRARVITFGFNGENDVRASDVELDWPNGTRFKLHAGGTTRDVRVRLIGPHMVYTVLAAAAVATAEGFTVESILPALEAIESTPGRMHPVVLANGAIVLRDDYKGPVESFDAALDVFSQIPARRRIVVLGEVTEPPGSQGAVYKRLGERVGRVASRVIFLGSRKTFKSYVTGAKLGGLPRTELIHVGKSVLDAVDAIPKDLGEGDVVLIKGRDTQRLERVCFALAGRRVLCDISYCDTRATMCAYCAMLERGWDEIGAAN